MLLCDVAGVMDSDQYLRLAWNDEPESDRCISIARRLDDRAQEIRQRYLEFIHDLGRTPTGKSSLIERFRLPRGLNLWWTSTIAEKSPFKSPAIIDCLKLLALEEVLRANLPSVLRVRMRGARGDAVIGLARALKIRVQREGAKRNVYQLKSVFRELPSFVQVPMWLVRHLYPRLVLRRVRRTPWFEGPRALRFFSYFFNISESAFREGKFRPAQWGDLPAFLASRGAGMNFAHHFLSTPAAPRPRDAIEWVRTFNRDARRQGIHSFVDSFVGATQLRRAGLSYLRGAWRSLWIRDLSSAFTPRGSAASLWPLLRNDWRSSFRGRVAFQSAIWAEAFDRLMADLPRQRIGLYLQEGQGWERILIEAWRRHGHGVLIGVAHSTVRFWDLRYFEDPREYAGEEATRRPSPDEVALNGAVAEQMFRDASYPGKIVAVEALRFMHLARGGGPRRNLRPTDRATLLVAGDSVREATEDLLRCLAGVPRDVRARLRVMFKPHPWCPMDLAAFGLDDVESREEAIGMLIDESDMVCGGISSVTLEAYCAGAAVLVFVPRDSLNFSPVLGLKGSRMIRNSAEFASAMATAASSPAPAAQEAVFHLDRGLPRWTGLLRSHGLELAQDVAT
jgi:surface carbohydrate biosynthesis protein (TIGR04326 family)